MQVFVSVMGVLLNAFFIIELLGKVWAWGPTGYFISHKSHWMELLSTTSLTIHNLYWIQVTRATSLTRHELQQGE